MSALDFAEIMRAEKARARAAAAAKKSATQSAPAVSYPELDLAQFAVDGIAGVFYVPEFVSEDDQAELLRNIYSHPARWTQLTRRRLQRWGGIPHPGGSIVEPLPAFLQSLTGRVAAQKLVDQAPNHILLNEYSDGQGIGYHQDGPLYCPSVAILSLESPADFEFCETVVPMAATEREVLVPIDSAVASAKGIRLADGVTETGGADAPRARDEAAIAGTPAEPPAAPTPVPQSSLRKQAQQTYRVVQTVALQPRSLLVFRDEVIRTSLLPRVANRRPLSNCRRYRCCAFLLCAGLQRVLPRDRRPRLGTVPGGHWNRPARVADDAVAGEDDAQRGR
jgi:hypothetical protein